MVLKLLVFMVAVAVLEGVAGLQEKQFANETQIKANPDHKKRGRRLDKLPCIVEQGTCQRIGDHCDGIVRQGAEWCLHHRHFECCYPRGCIMDDIPYPDGGIAERSCMILICVKGDWHFVEYNDNCGLCCTYNTTYILPYVQPAFSLRYHVGVFRFSVQNLFDFGIDISLMLTGPRGKNYVDYILYYEPNLYVEITCDDYPDVYVSYYGSIGTQIIRQSPLGTVKQIPASDVYLLYIPFGICIIGSQGLTVCVYVDDSGPICHMRVCAYASPFLYNELNGLCDVWIPILPNGKRSIPTIGRPQEWTMLNGGGTTNINKFIESWQYPITRKLHNQGRKKRSSNHTGQVNNRTIIERSMSEIEKLCEEMNKGPCTILSSEECEEFKETCVSRISDSQE